MGEDASAGSVISCVESGRSDERMSLRVELHPSLEEIDPSAWNALVGDDDPFVEYAFLRALETSESVGPRAGWTPVHVTVWDDASLVGALPLYAKDNSWGEFIFDFSWARAATQLGVSYYPKLVAMAPFTPATGRRLLTEDLERSEIVRALVAGARAAAIQVEASSVHVLFVTGEERDRLIDAGMRPRLSMQFHWHNEGYASFDEYLSRFRSSKRKQVRKERRKVSESGLEVRVVSGSELDAQQWSALRAFYRENCARHGSYPYLSGTFFSEYQRLGGDRLVAVLASRSDGEPVAASINFEKGNHLYGRYWGCAEHHEFLHFELCYYRLIERAIERSMARFEAGAQGFHKLKRGLIPAEVHSTHWIAEPRLRGAIERYLPNEAADTLREIAYLRERAPFRRGD